MEVAHAPWAVALRVTITAQVKKETLYTCLKIMITYKCVLYRTVAQSLLTGHTVDPECDDDDDDRNSDWRWRV